VSDSSQGQPPGWYYAQGDPPDTQRYWDGTQWQGGPQPVPSAGQAGPGMVGNAGGAAGQLADSGKRIIARIIDAVIWTVIISVFAVAVGGGASSMGSTSLGRSWFAGVLATLAIVAYEVLMVSSKGATLGKSAMGMKVVKEDGSPADMNAALMRMVTYLIGIVPFVGGLISFVIGLVSLVFLFTDEKRQAIWDKIAKTLVVEA
jgi:uncharacterized RDD family membrane protein YckC